MSTIKKLKEELEAFDEYDEDEVVEYVPKDGDEDEYVVAELMAGITVISALAGIAVAFIPGDRVYNLTGFIVGVLLAFFMVFHMDYTTKRAICMDENSIGKYLQRSSVIRMIVVFIVMAGVFAFSLGDVVLILVGVMSLKVAVYIQPFTDKLFKKILKRRLKT